MPFIVPLYPQMARSQNVLILQSVKFYCLQCNLVKKKNKKKLSKRKEQKLGTFRGVVAEDREAMRLHHFITSKLFHNYWHVFTKSVS